MKKFLKIGAAVAAVCLAAGFFASCDGEDGDSVPVVAAKMALKKAISSAPENATILLGNCTLEANDSYTITKNGVTIANGDVNGATFVIEGNGVTLSNLKNIDTVIVDEKVGDGDFTMVNCPEAKVVVVNGGGSNSVHISKSGIQKLSVNKAGVRVLLEEAAEVAKAYVLQNCKLESTNIENKIKDCILSSNVGEITLKGPATIEKLVSEAASANKPTITIESAEGSDSKVEIQAADSVIKESVGSNVSITGTVEDSEKNSLTADLTASKNEALLSGLVGFWEMEDSENGYYVKNSKNLYVAKKVGNIWYCYNDEPYALSVENENIVASCGEKTLTCIKTQNGLVVGDATLTKAETVPNLLDAKYIPKPSIPTFPEGISPTLPESVGTNELAGRKLVQTQIDPSNNTATETRTYTFDFKDNTFTETKVAPDKKDCWEEVYTYTYNATTKLIYAKYYKLDGMTFQEYCDYIKEEVDEEDREDTLEYIKGEFSEIFIYKYELGTTEGAVSKIEEACDFSVKNWTEYGEYLIYREKTGDNDDYISLTIRASKMYYYHNKYIEGTNGEDSKSINYEIDYEMSEVTGTDQGTIIYTFDKFDDWSNPALTDEEKEKAKEDYDETKTFNYIVNKNDNTVTYTKDSETYTLTFSGDSYTNGTIDNTSSSN